MYWYSGSIAEAVALSKQKNAIFVVFVEGDNELSTQMASTIDDPLVLKKLSDQNNFLAIKLRSGSTDYTHFAQLYQLVPVPSLFFIGRNGTPLEVVAAGVHADNLATRVDRILELHYKDKSPLQPCTSSQSMKQSSVNLLQAESNQMSSQPGSSVQDKVEKSQEFLQKETTEPPLKVQKTEHESPSTSQHYDIVCDGDVCVRRPKNLTGTTGETSGTSARAKIDPTSPIPDLEATPMDISDAKTSINEASPILMSSKGPEIGSSLNSAQVGATSSIITASDSTIGATMSNIETTDSTIGAASICADSLDRIEDSNQSAGPSMLSSDAMVGVMEGTSKDMGSGVTPGTSSSPSGMVPQDDIANIDEKLEKAKELIEVRRREKAEKEKELEKQKELERRAVGQGVAELKRWQAEQELKQIQQERMREKLENKLARQRILDQIAQDRAERKARDQPPPNPQQAQQAGTSTPGAGDVANQARIQFKLPDGGSHTATFESDSTLLTLNQYVADNLQMSASSFTLWTAFPRQELNDTTSSLRDLRLCPSSALLVMPRRSRAVVPSSSFVNTVITFLTNLINSLIIEPTQQVYAWILTRLFPPARPSNEPDRTSGVRPLTPVPPTVRRRNNIHRLHEDRPSDDDNNTWNGNSTQQM